MDEYAAPAGDVVRRSHPLSFRGAAERWLGSLDAPLQPRRKRRDLPRRVQCRCHRPPHPRPWWDRRVLRRHRCSRPRRLQRTGAWRRLDGCAPGGAERVHEDDQFGFAPELAGTWRTFREPLGRSACASAWGLVACNSTAAATAGWTGRRRSCDSRFRESRATTIR